MRTIFAITCLIALNAASALAEQPPGFFSLEKEREKQQGPVQQAVPPARFVPIHPQRSLPVPPRPAATTNVPGTTHFGRPEHAPRLTPEQAQQLLSIFNESR